MNTRMNDAEFLIQGEEHYWQLFNCSPIPQWVYDHETLQLLDVNEAAIRYYGFTRKEFLMMVITDILPYEYLQELLDRAEQETFISQRAIRCFEKTRDLIFIKSHGVPVSFQGRKAMLVVAVDNTLVDLSNYIHTIEKQNARLQDIAWTHAHLVRAPIARIMGLADLLSEHKANEIISEELLLHFKISLNELDTVIRSIIKKSRE